MKVPALRLHASELTESGFRGQSYRQHQACGRHEIRVVKGRRQRRGSIEKLHLRDVLLIGE